MRIILALLIVCGSNYAFAIDAYKCTIDYTATLQDNGDIQESDFTKLWLGKEFVVDKGTGRIKGGLSNDNAFGKPQIIDYGSKEQAFKVLTIFKPSTTINYLYIEEFNENQEKPFMFIDGTNIFSGKCLPY